MLKADTNKSRRRTKTMRISTKIVSTVILLQILTAGVWGIVVWQKWVSLFPLFRFALLVLCALVLVMGFVGGLKVRLVSATTATLTLVSIAILLWKWAPVDTWINGITSYAMLTMFMGVIHFVSFPMSIGKYNMALLKVFTRRASTTRAINRGFQFMSYIIGFISMFAGIPLSYFSTKPTAEALYKKGEATRILVNGWIRGWYPGMLLTPISVPMAISIAASGATWAVAAPYLAIQSFPVFAVSLLFFAGPREPIDKSKIPEVKEAPSLIGFVVGTAVLVATIAFAPILTGLNPVWCMAVFIVVVSTLWLVAIGKSGPGSAQIKTHLTETLSSPGISGMSAMILAIGFLGTAIGAVPEIVALMGGVFTSIVNVVGILGLLIAIVLFHVILGYVGVNPFIVSPLLATVLRLQNIAVDSTFLMLALLAGQVWAITHSPLGIAPIVMASLTGDPEMNSFKINLRWNLTYALVSLLVECLAIAAIYFVFYPV